MHTNGTKIPLPPGWSDDYLSDFIQTAFTNSVATFVHKRPAFNLLLKIDDIFRKIGENLGNPEIPLAASLLHRSYSAYLASCRLAMSGQATETFPLLRSCLEYALYALHINANPDLAEVWFRRHDNDELLHEVRKNFSHKRVMNTLLNYDTALYADITALYERTIDFGGHPNERAVSISTSVRKEGKTEVVRNQYLHGNTPALNHALKNTAQIGLGSLLIFRLIFGELFGKFGLSDTVDALRKVL